MRRRALLGLAAAAMVGACRGRARTDERTLVLKHQPMWGDPAPLRALIRAFERVRPEWRVRTELVPSAPEALHQHYLTALQGDAAGFDVFVADVVWLAELVRAGWVAPLDPAFTPTSLRRDFLPSSIGACIVTPQGRPAAEGRVMAVPWWIDVGLLYYRSDLVNEAPASYDALLRAARDRDPSLAGFVWQGRQYEGLVCNGFEAMWGHGASSSDRIVVDDEPARAGLERLRALIVEGISPASVITATEEDSRRLFQSGRALFMRNWPYAIRELQASAMRDRFAIAPLPTLDGRPGAGALGGWYLVASSRLPEERRRAAADLIAHLTSREAAQVLSHVYGRNPARADAYDGALAHLKPHVERARSRPVSPYYPMISDVLQSEMSAVVAGIRDARRALSRARSLVDHVVGATG